MAISVELCAGAGGQALGLERAGFEHAALVENDQRPCETLRLNRPHWPVFETDLQQFDASPFAGADLVAGGLPCPPFSIAGKQLGAEDERNLFPAGLRVVSEVRPRAVFIENVKGLLGPSFAEYREWVENELASMGYHSQWKLVNACDFGVPQLRPRAVLVAIRKEFSDNFSWPTTEIKADTVGRVLYDLMKENGWHGVNEWRKKASKIAPTIVGGSKKHGGPDLGPTRARQAWEKLGVNGKSIAEEAPEASFSGMPRLTVKMVARLQGFPDEWKFSGRKTPAYRQIGNAFPPPVAEQIAKSILMAITKKSVVSRRTRNAA